MFLKDTGRKKYKSILDQVNAVIQRFWIAAFLVSTNFDTFQHAPPGTLFEYAVLCALVARVRFFVPFFRGQNVSVCPRCRSPPLISILAINSKSKFGGSI